MLAGHFMDFETIAEALTVPNPLKDLPPLKYDLALALAAERRVGDISLVNAARGPELLALFNRACFSLSKIYSDLHLQLQDCKKRVQERKATLLVDVIPEKVKAKGLQDNVMTRQAFLDLDEEYGTAAHIERHIEAAMVYIDMKLKATESALSSIKKVLDSTNNTYRRPNLDLIQGLGNAPSLQKEAEVIDSTPRIDTPVQPSTTAPSRYGKPRYGPTYDND